MVVMEDQVAMVHLVVQVCLEVMEGRGGLGGLAGSSGPQWFRFSNTGSYASNCQFSLTNFYSSYTDINFKECIGNCQSTSGCTHITYNLNLNICYIYLGLITQYMANYSPAFSSLCIILGIKLFFILFKIQINIIHFILIINIDSAL